MKKGAKKRPTDRRPRLPLNTKLPHELTSGRAEFAPFRCRCCGKGWARTAGDNGYHLPFCLGCLRLLTRPMFDKLVLWAAVSCFDSVGVYEANNLVRTCCDWINRKSWLQLPRSREARAARAWVRP